MNIQRTGTARSPLTESQIHDLSRRIVLAIRILHARGFELLRAAMRLENGYWTCRLWPCPESKSTTRLVFTEFDPLIVFGCEGLSLASPAQIADAIQNRYADFLSACSGIDPEYTDWFIELTKISEPDGCPYQDETSTGTGSGVHVRSRRIGVAVIAPAPPSCRP